MAVAVPGALNDWAPTWWPADALDAVAAVLAPEMGEDVAPWFAPSLAGLEQVDGRRSIPSF